MLWASASDTGLTRSGRHRSATAATATVAPDDNDDPAVVDHQELDTTTTAPSTRTTSPSTTTTAPSSTHYYDARRHHHHDVRHHAGRIIDGLYLSSQAGTNAMLAQGNGPDSDGRRRPRS